MKVTTRHREFRQFRLAIPLICAATSFHHNSRQVTTVVLLQEIEAMFGDIPEPINAPVLHRDRRVPCETMLIEACIGRSRVENSNLDRRPDQYDRRTLHRLAYIARRCGRHQGD